MRLKMFFAEKCHNYVIIIQTVSLHLAEKHLPENHFPEKHFPELAFAINHTCQNEHLQEITSARINTCLKTHPPE